MSNKFSGKPAAACWEPTFENTLSRGPHVLLFFFFVKVAPILALIELSGISERQRALRTLGESPQHLCLMAFQASMAFSSWKDQTFEKEAMMMR